ncbi:proline-rich receptor-like protein kinase PERK7 isoform X2 [Jatropha curcas]|uniref:proline-rich receptor-like protein kinase PERK7 isoform X2 n=1 Tax=Jatropha curcas TaxID=180498 RepID=UPI0009D65532|nr:proline-rich receptor-like protein kinase PERK7 isoform X2 [Jatropha curcas]
MASAPSPDSSPSPPPPPSSSANSPSPSSSPSPPPPLSSPPPPPNKKSSPPPPSNKAPPPPNNSNASPPPPPSSSKTNTPPPPSSSNTNTPPPPPNNSDNNDKFSPPPSPPSSSKSSRPPLPPPLASGSTDKSSSTIVPIVIGVVVGVAAMLLLASLVYLCTSKKKKKKRIEYDYYSSDPSPALNGGNSYYPTTQRPTNNWQMGNQYNNDQMGNLPPPPGAHGWPSPSPPPPPAQSPGPHGPALPPPHPLVALGFTHSCFSYEELAAATDGFSKANLLGQGGFGYVHKGVLANGKEIAVKSLKVGSGQGDREFQAEVEIISRVHHRHLVSLVGYCMAGGQRLLVYEFLPNSTLEHHLYGKGQPTMDWSTRLKIALGSAKGLAYLHEDCHPRIIHRDIKAANILLDFNFEAKVADFGLAKLNSDNFTHVSTRVMGTFGYLAPEYASSGKLTEKSDVFSFGVMLLELISGRRPVDINSEMDESLVDWARPLCASTVESGNFQAMADPRLDGNYDSAEMARMVACAGAAIRHSARRRPKMSQIVRALEGDVSLDHLNEGVKTDQRGLDSTSYSSEYDSASYSADIKKFRKMILMDSSQEYASSDYGHTSEYGLNPSSSSSEGETGSGKNSPR